MTQELTNRTRLTREKRIAAARARRLAQTFIGHDRERLLEFAADLDREADAFEAVQIAISLPPIVEARAVPQDPAQEQPAHRSSSGPDP